MDITHLIAHPEELDQETLYDLRRIVAIHPTFHAARILFLQNLFLLHDTTFDHELRRAALLVPDRRVLFAMTQSIAHTHTTPTHTPDDRSHTTDDEDAPTPERPHKRYTSTDTTTDILDNLLQQTTQPLTRRRIKADPSTDYMAYLMQQEEALHTPATQHQRPASPEPHHTDATPTGQQGRLDLLIDTFIASQQAGITLPDNPTTPEGIITEEEAIAAAHQQPEPTAAPPQQEQPRPHTLRPERTTPAEAKNSSAGGPLTEILLQTYIKQQRYDRALEIASKIGPKQPHDTHTPYLEDQIRFLQKLALISRRTKGR